MAATTTTGLNEWLATVAPLAESFDKVGVRVMPEDVRPEVGSTIANSWDWYEAEYGSGERVELDGACAIEFAHHRIVQLLKPYFGRYVALIGGWYATTGDDAGEIIIRDSRVLAVFDRGEMGLGAS